MKTTHTKLRRRCACLCRERDVCQRPGNRPDPRRRAGLSARDSLQDVVHIFPRLQPAEPLLDRSWVLPDVEKVK